MTLTRPQFLLLYYVITLAIMMPLSFMLFGPPYADELSQLVAVISALVFSLVGSLGIGRILYKLIPVRPS